jgi:hypothetical protein
MDKSDIEKLIKLFEEDNPHNEEVLINVSKVLVYNNGSAYIKKKGLIVILLEALSKWSK